MNEYVGGISAGDLDLDVYAQNPIEYKGFEAQEFRVKGWREEFHVLIWNDSGCNFVRVCDFEDVVGTVPKKIAGGGTYKDLVNLPEVKFEVLGWIACRDSIVADHIRKYKAIRDALKAIRQIQEDRYRIGDPDVMIKIYRVYEAGMNEFESGAFHDFVERELSQEAADLLPDLRDICYDMIGVTEETLVDAVAAAAFNFIRKLD